MEEVVSTDLTSFVKNKCEKLKKLITNYEYQIVSHSVDPNLEIEIFSKSKEIKEIINPLSSLSCSNSNIRDIILDFANLEFHFNKLQESFIHFEMTAEPDFNPDINSSNANRQDTKGSLPHFRTQETFNALNELGQMKEITKDINKGIEDQIEMIDQIIPLVKKNEEGLIMFKPKIKIAEEELCYTFFLMIIIFVLFIIFWLKKNKKS